MTYTIKAPTARAIITMMKADFNCPNCEHPHEEKDYYDRMCKTQHGLLYMKCKGCGEKLGVTTDIRGDVVVWEKSKEKI